MEDLAETIKKEIDIRECNPSAQTCDGCEIGSMCPTSHALFSLPTSWGTYEFHQVNA